MICKTHETATKLNQLYSQSVRKYTKHIKVMRNRWLSFIAPQRELNRIKIIPLNSLNILTLLKCFALKPIITTMTTLPQHYLTA